MVASLESEKPPTGFLRAPRDASEGTVRCWTFIQRAVLTHDALPAATRKAYLTSDLKIIHDPMEAYGWSDQRPARFQPSARDVTNWLPVYGWLCWLATQKHGKTGCKILECRARSVPWWKLSQRVSRSEKTVRRYFDGAVAQVYTRFDLEVWTMELGR
jgi:hypothetical protein